MNVPIKFRAETLDGYPVFGGVFIDEKNVYIAEGFRFTQVKPKTLAQLAGCDSDGNEVYEGDILYLDYDGRRIEYKARIRGEAASDKEYVHSISKLKLKKG